MRIKVKSQKSKAKSCINLIVLLIAYCLLPIASNAQCAMCRAALESEGNKTKAQAVNDGIIYLMAIPYLIVGFVGFFIYRMYTKKK
jgi:phosphatidylglycerophosphatase A